jgi:alkanesulfonate monooxygenase SsuD/methylene tetrahydromethanopterin reductase-like flavin-dependent oxidoreductase (luciferase family)
MVDFGIHVAGPGAGDPPDRLAYFLDLLRAGEGAFRAAWVSDHLQKENRPRFEGWTELTYLAALAPTYRFGHMVLGQSYRNPALLAKMAATLQQLTGGRFVLGLGAGWQEDEYASYNYPFPSPGTRIEQLGEAIDLIRTMWRDSPATFEGRHYRVTEAYCEPRPDPAPRILVGGQGPRLMRLVAEKADAWVWDGPLEIYRVPYDRLLQSCAAIGRDLASVHLVAGFEAYFPPDAADFPAPYHSGYLDFMTSPFGPRPADAIREIERLIELGVAEFCCYFWDVRSLEVFRDEVIPHFGA